jgi:2-dehydropantoate 2-reductase
MRIAVFGTGGAGGYFGGRLAQAGEDVTFIARGEHLQAIREHGLQVDSVNGDFVIQPAQATDNPVQVGVVDVVLVGVKAWQVPEAAQAMRSLIGSETYIIPLQNGVEAPSQLAEVLGARHVLGGLAKIISVKVGPGRIHHAGIEPYVAFGELDGRPSERVERLRQAFERARVTVEIPLDIRVALWDKFLFVVSWGGMGAVTRAPIGVVRSVPETRQMLEQVMREILAVAQARKIGLLDNAIRRTMTFVDTLPPSGTTSLQRDIVEGKPSELDSWNGAVVRLGKELGVATPLNTFIYRSLLPLELQARGQLQFPA